MVRTKTVSAHGGGELFIDMSSVQPGESFSSAKIVGYGGDVPDSRIGDYVAFDPDTMEEIRNV